MARVIHDGDPPPPDHVVCPAGTYSADGTYDVGHPEQCLTIPAAFTSSGCWTLVVPDGKNVVDVVAVGAAGAASESVGSGGRGDQIAATVSGLDDGDRLRVCVNKNGGTAGIEQIIRGGDGGGGSGVAAGPTFQYPMIIAGGGGGAGDYTNGGDAGMPAQPGQDGDVSDPGNMTAGSYGFGGTGGGSSVGLGGAAGSGGDAGNDGTQWAAGVDIGRGGNGGDGYTSGGGGGGGYYGGGGGGSGPTNGNFAGGGGGGASLCADNNGLTVTGCARTGGVGTSHASGGNANEAHVSLTFRTVTPEPCAVGTYSATGNEPCTEASAGHFVDTAGATAQSECALGFYQPNTAQASCLAADIGYYVDSTGSDHETGCPSGEITSATSSDSIDDCFDPTPTDVTIPEMGQVSAYLRDDGHVGSATITVAWSATDDTSDSANLTYEVERRRLKGGTWGNWGGTQTVVGGESMYQIPLWRTQQFRVRAQDEAGNWSNWAVSNTIYPLRRDDRHFKFVGDWTREAVAGAMRGHYETGTAVGLDFPSATFKFKGNGIAVIVTNVSGALVDIGVDGNVRKLTPPDELRTFAIAFIDLGPGKHMLTVQVVSGTAAVDGAIITR
jgi:hypothetical protein